MIRSREIYISPDTHQLLLWLVAAHNSKLSDQDSKLTVDALANDALMQFVKTMHPKLIGLWERREALNKEAVELLK